MQVLRLILGIVTGLILITIITESIEFLIVKLVSGESFEFLSANQDYYFGVRNHPVILIAKLLYTGGSGVVGGFVAARISRSLAHLSMWILIASQVISLFWAGFLSNLASTGPIWMWIGLILIVPTGIFLGYRRAKALS